MPPSQRKLSTRCLTRPALPPSKPKTALPRAPATTSARTWQPTPNLAKTQCLLTLALAARRARRSAGRRACNYLIMLRKPNMTKMLLSRRSPSFTRMVRRRRTTSMMRRRRLHSSYSREPAGSARLSTSAKTPTSCLIERSASPMESVAGTTTASARTSSHCSS
jgi:hypothetical protein